jgi:hypothetical protein
MLLIRKLVGYTGIAAGISAAIAIAMSSQAGLAAAPASRAIDQPTVAQVTPSADCLAAIQKIKDAVALDRSEDAAERAVAKTTPDEADQAQDQIERANFKSLFVDARTACAPAVAAGATAPPTETRFVPSSQCTAAIQALKAALPQGPPKSAAQWQQLQSLARAVRTACGMNVVEQRWDTGSWTERR